MWQRPKGPVKAENVFQINYDLRFQVIQAWIRKYFKKLVSLVIIPFLMTSDLLLVSFSPWSVLKMKFSGFFDWLFFAKISKNTIQIYSGSWIFTQSHFSGEIFLFAGAPAKANICEKFKFTLAVVAYVKKSEDVFSWNTSYIDCSGSNEF